LAASRTAAAAAAGPAPRLPARGEFVATHPGAGDVERFAKTGAHVSFSPYTEMRTGFGFGPVSEYLATGVLCSLSIDTVILAGRTDMFASPCT
jgi:cytosine/adenosine deaminase-related metal-dependent hydrolase